MAPNDSPYRESQALLIGINQYQEKRFVPLGEAEADCKKLSDVLQADPYHFKVKMLLGKDATRQAILEALYELNDVKDETRVLVYFAGHGYTRTDRFGAETGYLAAYDTRLDQDFTALKLDEVTDLRRRTKAMHVGFVFDSCFSGQAMGLTRSPSVAAEKFLSRRAYQVLSAGTADQTVLDANSMTDYLVSALHDKETGIDGVLTFSDLGLTVQQKMASDSGFQQIPQFGHLQGSQGGDMVFQVDDVKALQAGITVRPSRQSKYVEPDRPKTGGDEVVVRDIWWWLERLGVIATVLALPLAFLALFIGPENIGNFFTGADRVTPTVTVVSRTSTPTPRSPSPTPTDEVSPTPSATDTPAPTATPEPTATEIPGLPAVIEADDGAEMVLVEEGEFRMGVDDGAFDEGPRHRVLLSDYYIDRYEVTNSQYEACVDAGVCDPPAGIGSARRNAYYGYADYDFHPVIFIDWEDATAYCAWRGDTLPTEAQWEKAAGWDPETGDMLLFPWGDDPLSGLLLNYAGESLAQDTVDVGRFDAGASPVGAFDMLGNVWEWVQDYYRDNYYQISPLRDPHGPADADDFDQRVLRGGSWTSIAPRITERESAGANFVNDDIGFRCARDCEDGNCLTP